jgi:hypothetical protein
LRRTCFVRIDEAECHHGTHASAFQIWLTVEFHALARILRIRSIIGISVGANALQWATSDGTFPQQNP